MPVSRIEFLLNAYLQGLSTEQEEEELFSVILDGSEYESLIEEGLLQYIKQVKADHGLSGPVQNKMITKILRADTGILEIAPFHTGWDTARAERRKAGAGRTMKMKRLLRYAAVLAFLIAGSAYLWLNEGKSERERLATQNETKDIAPGGDKAVLTLADGTKIILDSTDNGTLARQGEIRVIKLNSGALAYDMGKHGLVSPQKGALLYNTIATPRGGQYQLVLADGTKVWMNAASSLRFPVAFANDRRMVEITGEAYFEVATDKYRPFVVVAESVRIEVLGTSFNINAYPDEESINTTLVEGAVRLNAGKFTKTLAPGQQARVDENGQHMKVVNNVEVEGITAWRNGKFIFSETPIDKAMRQISRWYDVDVSYTGKIPNQTFNGVLSRDKNLSQILKVFEIGQVHFKMEGKKLVVMPPDETWQ